MACVPDGMTRTGDLEGDSGEEPSIDATVAKDTGPIADAGVTEPDAGDPIDAAAEDAAAPDATDAMEPMDAGEEPVLVEVGHPRELRAIWVATVTNINFPSGQNLSAQQQQAELRAIVDATDAINANAIVFQVRPEADALYASALEPWSRFLTGTQGGDPGYDPLQYLIDEAHARAIEVHAWFNPYRAKTNVNSTAVQPHISLVEPNHAHQYGTALWMDPAAAPVQQRTVDVIADVVSRYEVDGVHLDDYFYPYPIAGTPFPDDQTYSDYLTAGGTLDLDDWRRENVHTLVAAINAAITMDKPHVRFGIAPFGIYRPGMPPGITGLDQYAAIYSDPIRWIDEGWVEYLAPQLYWPTTQTAQAYEPLLEWWVDQAGAGTYLFSGNYLSRLGDNASWTVDEFRAQLDLNRTHQPADRVGEIFFQIDPIMENRDGINDVLRDEYYPKRALTPIVGTAPARTVPPPAVTIAGGTVMLSHPDPLRAYAVYRDAGGSWELEEIHPGATTELTLGTGTWAISAADPAGYESMGVVVSLP
jgi:uncharacterized lipoprotein YddW (UPF0748 family)